MKSRCTQSFHKGYITTPGECCWNYQEQQEYFKIRKVVFPFLFLSHAINIYHQLKLRFELYCILGPRN
jgi:hypothetical protein